MSFANDIEKFVKKTGANADKVMRNVVLDIGKSLVMKTPVGDPKYWKSKPPKGYAGGHARGNWQHSVGIRVTEEIDCIDKSGQKSIDRINATIPDKSAGLVHYIQNSVPYIKRLEEGHSRQAPHGMVALTEIEFKDYMSKALAALK
jgi:hypothetical protein